MAPAPIKQVKGQTTLAFGRTAAAGGDVGGASSQKSLMNFFKKDNAGSSDPVPQKSKDKKAADTPVVAESETAPVEETKTSSSSVPASSSSSSSSSSPKAAEKAQATERRSKKAEDKKAPPPKSAEAEEESSASVPASKPRKRIRKDDDEDDDSDDDVLDTKKSAEAGAKKSKKAAIPALEAKAQAMDVEKKASKANTVEEDEEEEDKEGEDVEEEEDDSDGEEEEEEEDGKTGGGSSAGALRSVNSVLKMKKKAKSKPKAKAQAASTKKILTELRELKPGSYPSLPYRTFTDVLEAIESLTGRLEITDIVRELLIKTIECCPQDLPILMYLLCGKIAPAYEGTEMGIGDSSLIAAIAGALGCTAKQLDQKGEGKDGDIATTAQKFKTTQRTLGFAAKPVPLSMKDVLEGFRQIAACSGDKSMTQKSTIIRRLLLRCAKEGNEVKFLVRGLQCKLRCRLAEPTVLTALGQAFIQAPPTYPEGDETAMQIDEENEPVPVRALLNPKSGKADKAEAAEIIVKQAYSECPNYDFLIKSLLEAPMTGLLKKCSLQPGIPVKPMLAKAQDSFQEILKRMAGLHFTMEYKYDGERAQIHMLQDGTIKIFSRNSEDTTPKYPDLVAVLPQAIKEGTTSFVIDAEAVAIDPETKKLQPFQILSTRKRKAEKVEDIKVQVVIYAFDILYLNDRPVLQETLLKRRSLLRDAFAPVEGKFEFAISMDHHEDGDTMPIEAFLDEAVTGNCEGLMIKTLEENATYEPTKRSLNWLKLKKDYLSTDKGKGPADSLDLVVIGGNYGQGKRTGWYGAFLLACYDPEQEEYQSVCKIGTGFSEEFLAKIKPEFDKLIIPNKPGYFNTGLDSIDVWFEPKTVWEVRAADLSKSSTHKGALNKVENGKGIALRFPRFIRDRPDKNPEDATNCDQLVDAYKSQALVESNSSSAKGARDDDDDDGYI